MKKIINILLLFVFATAFFACEKEIIKPLNEKGEHIECFMSSDDNEDLTRDSKGDSRVIIDGDVTDPDEEEDFEEEESVTDPDEEEDFEEEDFSK